MSKNLAKNGFGLGLVLLAFGAFILYTSHKSVSLAKATESWPSVTGKVVSAKVKSKTKKKISGRELTRYYPIIEYSYTVGDKDYTNRKITYVGRIHGQSDSQAAVDKYPAGSEVQVYYNPENPAQAVLEAGAADFDKRIYYISGGLIFAGLACFVVVIVKRKASAG